MGIIDKTLQNKYSLNQLKSLNIKGDRTTKKVIMADKVLGLRAYGLIIWGNFPLYLNVFLGLGKSEIKQLFDIFPPYVLVIVLILSVILVFALIKGRSEEWYLTTDYLNTRSVIITFGLILWATFICEVSGGIRGQYTFGIPSIFDLKTFQPAFECLVIAAINLAISFLLIVKIFSNPNLPGLPSKEFVKSIKIVNQKLKEIKDNKIWECSISFKEINEFANLLEETNKCLSYTSRLRGNTIAKKSLQSIKIDFDNLTYVVEKIRGDSSIDITL